MIGDISLLAAFVAGLLSITSPCVLPLIPIYLAHLAGVSLGARGMTNRARVMLNAVAFVVGFSVVFVLLGLAAGALGAFVADERVWLVRFGGVLLVIMGLHLIGFLRVPMLDRERRLEVVPRAGGLGRLGSSVVVGAAFGAGWTPCVGPVLGAVLTLAAGRGQTGDAAVLLSAYALGFAVPFLAAAAAVGSAPRILRRVNRHLGAASSVNGGIVLAVGVILLLGIYDQLFAELARRAPWRPWEPDL